MSWTLIALSQVALLAVLLFVSAALLRRAQPAVATAGAGASRGGKRKAGARKHSAAPDEATLLDDLRASVASLSAGVADTRDGWRRLREGLHKVLEGAQPVMEHSSWDEIHRLLCAADKLHGVPSPPITFREDEEDELPAENVTEDRWRALVRGLQELRAAATNPDHPGLADEEVKAMLGALILAVDELRTRAPEVSKQESARETELRQMILQFTHDSRDMLLCIRRLESENANLRTQLGLAPVEEA